MNGFRADLLPFGDSASRFAVNFWKKVDRRGPDECWPWTEYRDEHGYGRFCTTQGRRGVQATINAHRLALCLHLGRWIGEALACHHCDNPPCCNPAHLYEGTEATNGADKAARRRAPIGEWHPHAILTDAEVVAARRAYSDGTAEAWQLAKQYGVRVDTMATAIHGETYPHLPGASPRRHLSRSERRLRYLAINPIPRGGDNANAVLTEADVRYIREQLATDRRGIGSALARQFGVTKTQISAIKHRRTWAWLDTPPSA